MVCDGGDFWYHASPDVKSGVGVGVAKLDFEEESAFESGVEVFGEVGGGDEDAIEFLHLFEDDVLHSVFHLLN